MSSILEIQDEFEEIIEETLLDVEAELEEERSEGIAKYIEDKNRFKVYRLKKKLEKYWDHVLHIYGYFGTRKTLTTIHVIEKLSGDRSYDDVVWIFASPLRALRNKIATLFKSRTFIMKAHDELVQVINGQVVEEPLRNHIKRLKKQIQCNDEKCNRRLYFQALHEHRKEVRRGNEDCWWIKEVATLIEFIKTGGRIIVTTHGLLPVTYSIISSYFRNWGFRYKIIIDEAESFFENVSTGFPIEDLEFIRSIDYRIYYNIKRFFFKHKESRELLFVDRELMYEILRNSILISATMPKLLLGPVELFLRTMDARKGRRSEYPIIKTHEMKDESRARDTVILYDKIFKWEETKKNLPLIRRWLIILAEKSIRKYGCFGILTRNYELSRDLYDFFRNKTGFRVFSDHQGSPDRILIRRGRWQGRIETDKEIIMVMVSGPIKQGIDIIPKSSKTGDVKVIVGFFQGKEDIRIYPDIQRELHEGLRIFSDEYDREPYELEEELKMQKLYGKNLQALHRFSRIRSNEHIYILLDKRWENAFNEYFRNRYWYSMNRLKFEKLNDLFLAAYKLI